jgi:hypothetical protein
VRATIQSTESATARYALAAGFVVSGIIHLLLTPEHLHEAPILGIGFLLVGVLQLGFAAALARSSKPGLWEAALVLTVFSLAMYILSRTAGLPFGHDHEVEAIAPIDLLCKGAEAVCAAVLLRLLHGTTRGWPRGRSLHLAPANRYGYLVALVAMGLFATALVLHLAGHLAVHGSSHLDGHMRPAHVVAGGQSGYKVLERAG